MNNRRRAIGVGLSVGALALGCRPDQPVTYGVQGQQVAGGEGTAPGQYLYLPASNVSVGAVQSVLVQSNDGRQFVLGAGDIRAAVAGRLAVPLPAGVSDGTATLTVNGQAIAIPFHVVVAMAAAPVLGTMQVASGDPRCAAIAGTWQGSIWRTQGSTASAYLQVMDDCRTVQGTISAAAPSSGSVDATIEGTWDPESGTLVARDTQLFNVRPTYGGSFCPTTRYELHMTPDGQLVGTNDTSGTSCGNIAPVRLGRVQ